MITQESIKAVKEIIKSELLFTKRKGVFDLADWMDENGFFTAPCSTQHHLSEPGGLAKHSLNVMNIAKSITYRLADTEEYYNMDSLEFIRSVVLCSIIHDLGKCGCHGKPLYVDNIVRSKKKNKETGEYYMIQSESKPYKTNSDLMYVDHEVRSVIVASQFIELTEEEEWAILMHNGLYGTFKYQIPGKETPLYMILHFADMWASRVMERNIKENTAEKEGE